MTLRNSSAKSPSRKVPLDSSPSPESTGDTKRKPFPIVGIGASAGGLEAIQALLKALPQRLGMAVVLVPHLDPHHESAFAQILARCTTMPVITVADGMPVEPDRVYVIPPNYEMTIFEGVLHIRDRAEPRWATVTIDLFLRSLAADQKSNAIGVILSGTGTDGTIGLTAIKGEGGITFAQDSESAKYDGMPTSAIAAGGVDFVLSPEAIARELVTIRQHPYVSGRPRSSAEHAVEHSDAAIHMGTIFRLLRRANNVDFSEYKTPTVERRIQRRMALTKVNALSEYAALLQRTPAEVQSLYHDLLINVTSFFRNPEAFEALKTVVYPELLKARVHSSAAIRVWVPGCSTGEEVYSHVISLVEFLSDRRVEIPIQVFGTDLSAEAIKQARAGVYKESIEADLGPVRLRRFFHKHDGAYQISKTIRDKCIFSTQNVFKDPPFSRMDLVSCRNVMIYLGQTLQRRVIPTFHYALNPQGFLMIGNTEGLLGVGSDLFEMADKKQKIYRKKMVATPLPLGMTINAPSSTPELAEVQPASLPPRESVKLPAELQREADRLLLARYVPPAVVVNQDLEILQSRGKTSQFLELPTGKASLNLLKMARPGLMFELQAAIDEARKTGEESLRDAHVQVNGTVGPATIRVVPFKAPLREQRNFLVVFEQRVASKPETSEPAAGGSHPAEAFSRDKQIAQLREELAATKEYLQAIIEAQEASNEELQSANEEIQSGNEELQSTNEELQTSKEELESANEELHTVNEEMQHRNELLTQFNNDLSNLLNSVNLPIVMVGADLSIRASHPKRPLCWD